MATRQRLSDAELGRRALQIRRDDLGLDPYEPLSPYKLAAEHGVEIYGLDDLAEAGCASKTLEYFTTLATKAWSAALVPCGNGCFIVENTSHTPQRRRSNVAHEVAHFLLEHEFDTILFSADAKGGCRNPASAAQEREAAELGAELLLTTDAARRAAIKEWSDDEVANAYDISIEMARWRMNGKGARLFAQRAKAKWRR